MTDLTLYHFPRTVSTRVRWWLEEAKIPYRSVTVDIRRKEQDTPAFRKISPLGRIPILIDGDLILRESLGICLHLGFRFPAAELSPPVGTEQFSRYLQWLSFAATEAHQVVGSCVAAHRARYLGQEKTSEAKARESFLQVLAIYEAQLSDTQFLAGNVLTGADIYNASLLAFADSIGLIPASGAVRKWLDRLRALPSYARALAPDEQATSGKTVEGKTTENKDNNISTNGTAKGKTSTPKRAR